MKDCYIIVGCSGSGKSTAVKRIIELASQVGRECATFSLDSCRMNFYETFSLDSCSPDFYNMIDADKKKAYSDAFNYANDNQAKFNSYVTGEWTRALLTADTVIVDNTNLTRKSRARWISEARARGFGIIAVNVMTPLSVVLERQSTRTDKFVPLDTVRDMYFRQQEVQADEYDVLLHVDGTSDGPLSGMIRIT